MRIILEGKTLELRAIWFEDKKKGIVSMIDQRLLPWKFEIFRSRSWRDTVLAIKEMIIRGAPSIGAAGAYAVAQAAIEYDGDLKKIRKAAEEIKNARPTAHDLAQRVHQVINHVSSLSSTKDVVNEAIKEAERIANEYVEINKRIGQNGEKLIQDGMKILTHCNAGALAAVDLGTALAPIRLAHQRGKKIFVYCTETRPWLQGARLTAWELKMEGIPHALIADSAAAYLMWKGEIDMVIVGADRIASNGDVANKIGTYSLALAAKENGIPFYVAAPISTFDFSIRCGENIVIEERSALEVVMVRGWDRDSKKTKHIYITYEECTAVNPVFDITPSKLISGYITEYGIFKNVSELREFIEKKSFH